MAQNNRLGVKLGEKLGIARGVILHVDDLGMCHSGNLAFLELFRRGLVTCGSVMVPCPWFLQIAAAACTDPSLDLGIHLTLTSEWEHYRWKPISTASATSGLTDPDGYFWRDVASLRRNLVPEAAELELRAQVERAYAAGLRPTHLDAHMAAAMLPELLEFHVTLAREYGLVPVLPRNIRFAPDQEAYDRVLATLTGRDLPLPDEFRGTLPVSGSETRDAYRQMMQSLPVGITHLALHSATPGDIEAIAPAHAEWRVREYALLAEGSVHRWSEEFGITPVGYRAIQKFWPAVRWPGNHLPGPV